MLKIWLFINLFLTKWSKLKCFCSSLPVFLHFQVNQRSDPILSYTAFILSLLHGLSLPTEIFFVKQNRNRAWFQVIPLWPKHEETCQHFLNCRPFITSWYDQTLCTPHMQLPTFLTTLNIVSLMISQPISRSHELATDFLLFWKVKPQKNFGAVGFVSKSDIDR